MKRCELYRHFDKNGQLLYVGIAWTSVERLMNGHRSNSHWFNDIVRIEIERFETREDARKAELEAIDKEKPVHNIVTKANCGISTRKAETRARIKSATDELRALGFWVDSRSCLSVVEGALEAVRAGDANLRTDQVRPLLTRRLSPKQSA